MDPDLVLAAGVGEGTGEEWASRVISPAPEEGGDPVTIGEADTARREGCSVRIKRRNI
jgi:hypothetical protein